MGNQDPKVAEVAKLLGLAECTIRTKIDRGELKAYHAGSRDAKRKSWRIDPDEVERFRRARKGEAEPDAPRRRMSPDRAALRAMAAQP